MWHSDRLGVRRQAGDARPLGHDVATAALFPESCPAVVTESAQAFVEGRTRAGLRAARAAFQQPGQLERLERYHGAKARWVLDSWIPSASLA
jgi:hypothetical protein